jgi:hypothetical protein
MKRKIIKQRDSYTVTLPIRWVRDNGLERNDEIQVSQEHENLVLAPGDVKKQKKKTEVDITPSTFNVYRSVVGGLFRGGYDEIKVNYEDMKIIPELQKALGTFYGLEMFDITKKSCVIRALFREEAAELSSHTNKIIHAIKTIQEIILDDMKNKRFNSDEELAQLRWNVIKQRDLIARTTVQQRLFDNKHFPYHTIAFNLWYIARAYVYMYKSLKKKAKFNEKTIDLFKKVSKYFSDNFAGMNKQEVIKKYEDFSKIVQPAIKTVEEKKEGSVVASYCVNILMLTQSCNSLIMQLNY